MDQKKITEKDIKSITKKIIIKSINEYAKKKIKRQSSFQVLNILIPYERKIRSIVGGLETSMGATLWEPLAKELAKNNGFEVKHEKLQSPVNMPSLLNNTVQNVYEDRKNKDTSLYDAKSSHEEIKKICQTYIDKPIKEFKKPASGSGVDVWLVKNNVNYFFDTKTVQPNLKQLQSFLSQLLEWYAFFYSRYPEQNSEARIIFPYNPHKPKMFWDNITGKGFPLEQGKEVWVEDEFWNFCSGFDGTFDIILETFKEINDEKILSKTFVDLFKEEHKDLF